jgi:hypothetical protein
MEREPVGYRGMRALRPSAISLVLLLSACGTGERACDLVEDVPERAELTTIEQVQEVAEAARESEVERIRKIGENLRLNLARRQALEALATDLFVDVVQTNLDQLRRACSSLGAGEN